MKQPDNCQSPFPNDFLILTSCFNGAELTRLHKAVADLGYLEESRLVDGIWCRYIVGLKPCTDDADALFELAEIEL